MKNTVLHIASAAALAAGLLVTHAALAQDFPATPLNAGAPANLPGENLVPGLSQAVTAFNTATQPLLQPILAPGGAAAAPEATTPVRRHHRFAKHVPHTRHLANRKVHSRTI